MSKVKIGLQLAVIGVLGCFILNAPIFGDPIRKVFNRYPANVKISDLPQKEANAQPSQTPQQPIASPTPQASASATPIASAPAQPAGDCVEPKKSENAMKYKVIHYQYAEVSDLIQVVGEKSDIKLAQPAAKAYLLMKAKAKESGIDLEIASGFRSVDAQFENFKFKAESDPSRSREDLVKYNSIAGFSEHHTGLALDIASKEYQSLNQGHAQSTAGKWLLQNAKSFGFELSFGPKNTLGVGYEPWHWRYVGDEGSKKTFCFVSSNYAKINPQ
jgi:zinc D-Ala-D-Ala carboxypeptidase